MSKKQKETEQEPQQWDAATMFMECMMKVYRPSSEDFFTEAVYKTTADLLIEFSNMCEVSLLDASKAMSEAKFEVEEVGSKVYWKLWRVESSIY